MKSSKIIIALLACIVGLTGCDVLERKHQAGVAVELNGHYLYQSTIETLTLGLNSEDSAQVAERFIRQWAEDNLIYDNAHAQQNDEIEQMVNNYRNTLYVQAYEQRLMEKGMSKSIADSTVEQFYQQVSDRLRLQESIVKGILVVVPNDAPMMQDLRQWLRMANGEEAAIAKAKAAKQKAEKQKTKGKNKNVAPQPQEETNILDDIEKYAYQYASGYELFTDEWKTASELQLLIPFERNDLDAMLRKNSQVELSDSTSTYLLQVTDKHLSGETMPMDYARPQIEEYILSTRKAEFMQSERERLYKEAIEEGKIVFFEK